MLQRWCEGESVRVREQHAQALDAYHEAVERLEGVIRWYYDRTPIQNRILPHHEGHEDAQSFYIEEYGDYSIEEVRQQLYAAFENAHAIFADMIDKVSFSARFYRQKWSNSTTYCKTPSREKKTRAIEPGSSVGWNSSSQPSRYSCWNASGEIAILLEIPRSDVGIKVFQHENLSNGLTVELPTSEELSDLWETLDSFSEWKELVSKQIYENSKTCQAHEAGRVHTV